jgi:hypothetical protein
LVLRRRVDALIFGNEIVKGAGLAVVELAGGGALVELGYGDMRSEGEDPGDGDGVEGYVGGEEGCNCGRGGVIMIMAAFEEVGAEKCREVDIRMAFIYGV